MSSVTGASPGIEITESLYNVSTTVSPVVSTEFRTPDEEKDTSQVGIAAGVVCAVMALVAVIILIFIVTKRRRRKEEIRPLPVVDPERNYNTSQEVATNMGDNANEEDEPDYLVLVNSNSVKRQEQPERSGPESPIYANDPFSGTASREPEYVNSASVTRR